MTDHSALNTILQPGGITPLYQPIVHVSNGHTQIRGVECLSRGPKGTNFESAQVLFDYVRLKREEWASYNEQVHQWEIDEYMDRY